MSGLYNVVSDLPMSFTASLRQTIQPIYQPILDHPFNQELAQDTLAREWFQFYFDLGNYV